MKAKGNFKLPDVTTLEVIDNTGKLFFNINNKTEVELVFEDQGKALKIYFKNKT